VLENKIRKHGGKRLLGRSECEWDNNIKMNIESIDIVAKSQ
jgi:hypothetical protein